MKKKVILVPGNTDLNRGDQALVWESIKVIKEVYDNPEVILMKGNDYRQYAQTDRLSDDKCYFETSCPYLFKETAYTILFIGYRFNRPCCRI